MDTLKFIALKYKLDLKGSSPIEIPNMGRNNLARLFAELGFKTGAEIGTERGYYAQVLCKANPHLKLFCIDAWTEIPGYRTHVKQGELDEIYKEAISRLSPFNCVLIKSFSNDAVNNFKNESLDFIYIDANHSYDAVTADLKLWSKKVKKGGIISGHDYARNTREVVRAVKDFTESNKILPWFTVGTEARVPNEIRDLTRSFMWVKT